jgi:hypothetical protein
MQLLVHLLKAAKCQKTVPWVFQRSLKMSIRIKPARSMNIEPRHSRDGIANVKSFPNTHAKYRIRLDSPSCVLPCFGKQAVETRPVGRTLDHGANPFERLIEPASAKKTARIEFTYIDSPRGQGEGEAHKDEYGRQWSHLALPLQIQFGQKLACILDAYTAPCHDRTEARLRAFGVGAHQQSLCFEPIDLFYLD